MNIYGKPINYIFINSFNNRGNSRDFFAVEKKRRGRRREAGGFDGAIVAFNRAEQRYARNHG